MPIKLTEKPKDKLTPAQESFFINGWVSPFWISSGEKEFPFRDEEERVKAWQRYKNALIKKMYEPRLNGSFRFAEVPMGNDLRPAEWFIREAPEEKRVLNGAVRVDPNNRGLFDREPLFETDFEFLSRLKMLTPEDEAYIQTEQFKEAEADAMEYRAYPLNN